MAYAQLTWRESLRDIEATLGANPSKLYAMGLRQAARRTTLADANERRDWRIWAAAFPASFTSATARCTMSTCWISCPSRPGPSTSWIGAIWTMAACTQCIRLAPSSSCAPSPTSMRAGCIRRQDLGFLDQQHEPACARDRPALQEPLTGRVVLQMDQAASANQEVFGHQQRGRAMRRSQFDKIV